MEAANLRLKLANGSLVKAVGLLKNFEVKALDHHVCQTFVVMDFNDKPSSYEIILGRPFMREHNMVHDWYNNQVAMTLHGKHICVNLKLGKAQPMASGILRDNTTPTGLCDSKPSTSLNLCTDQQEDTGTQAKKSAKNDGHIRDLDWTHVLATMDVWGKRGITCVNAEGDILPNFTSLNMIFVINPTDACNIQAEPRMRQIALTHLAIENKLEMSLREKHGKTPHANGKVHDVFTCETDAILSPSPLRTQIKNWLAHKEKCYTTLC